MNAELENIRDNLVCGHCQSVFQGTDSQARKVKYENRINYCSLACRAAAQRQPPHAILRALPAKGPALSRQAHIFHAHSPLQQHMRRAFQPCRIAKNQV